MASPPLQDLFAMLGGPVVLLEVRPRTKRPIRDGWQKLTIEDMTAQYLDGLNSGCNIGVSLGAVSRNLITIDFDTEERWQQMLALNPCFADTLLTHGNRGGNIWLYMEGGCLASCDIKDKDGTKVAEFRATGRQTIIRGIHQSGKHYANNGHTPLLKQLEEIVWADDLVLPWVAAATPEVETDSLDAQLIAECGPPIVVRKGSGIKINHAYFVRRFCLEHHVLFETIEGAFHLYEDSSGAWKYVDTGVIKELIRADWLRIAAAIGGNALSVMGTDTLLNQLTNGVRSYSGKAGAFKRLPRGLIHVGNGMLKIQASGDFELLSFSHEYFSRNPIPVNFNEDAKCLRFLKLVKNQVPIKDRSLLRRWMGSCLLEGNVAQRLIIFTGVGLSAKSTIVNLIVKLVGWHNVGALRTHLLNERFEIGRFHGKTILTACDVSGAFLQHAAAQVVKKLVGHDYVPGEVKGVMKETPVVGDFAMAITCNETLLVRLYGENDVTAWRRRLLLMNFPRPIDPAKRIPNYDDLLIAEEAEGILAYIVQGAVDHLVELENGGDFILSKEQKERVERLLTESQSLRFFVREQIVAQEGEDLTVDEIVRAYFSFCKEREWMTRPKRTIEAELKDLMPEIHNSYHTHHISRDEKNSRGYKNVAFRQEEEGPAW